VLTIDERSVEDERRHSSDAENYPGSPPAYRRNRYTKRMEYWKDANENEAAYEVAHGLPPTDMGPKSPKIIIGSSSRIAPKEEEEEEPISTLNKREQKSADKKAKQLARMCEAAAVTAAAAAAEKEEAAATK
jgi:hypothetical protein